MRTLFTLFWFAAATITCAQTPDLSVPDEILKELQLVKFTTDNGDTVILKVSYPANYRDDATYPVMLGLSRGNQSEQIVNYCYAAWFRSGYFNNYLLVLPVSNGKNLRDYTADEIKALIRIIKAKFNVSKAGWILSGTSTGGIAAFNFLAASPTTFIGAIVMPGATTTDMNIGSQWKHLKVLIAYGEKDSEFWHEAVQKTVATLKGKVKSITSFVMKGQGHVLPLNYNIEEVYSHYFDMK